MPMKNVAKNWKKKLNKQLPGDLAHIYISDPMIIDSIQIKFS